MLPKFKMAARGQLQIFVGAKTLKLLLSHSPPYGDVQVTENQNGHHGSTSIFWLAQNVKKLVWSIFFNFNIIFLTTCECASNFSKKLSKWPPESHPPQYRDLQVIFKDFAKNQNGRHGSILLFWRSQKLKW